ncbi:MAG: hypothetical protein KDE57_06845 [Calditrichaeota bacterium]|nr:hypothetical protein [Calditrichota bacterium]MCB0267501.1 hypothetical protein [Calditrichota bacterium]MCB0286357.1 hypothetical protein [Calditrichota bacterium]MCB9067464.1 hypothetical protein [Calditrichia bacterium]
MNRWKSCIKSTFLFVLLINVNLVAQTAVIVHKDVMVDSVDALELDQIYTLFLTKWNGDQPVIVFFPKYNEKLQKSLFGTIHRKSIELKRVWLRKKLTGEATPPIAINSTEEMLEKVSTTPGSIGLIDAKKVTKAVKVVAIFP